jgi:predicted nucleic acid-binding protein
MIWNDQTRRETRRVLSRIPRLSWVAIADLFREDDRYAGDTTPQQFDYIQDPDDRKFAALAEAAGVVLITNDDHLLSSRARSGLTILTPVEFCRE